MLKIKHLEELRVLKFGGSSLANPNMIKRVAELVHAHKKECQNIVVVVSAMGDTTDNLIYLAKQVTPNSELPSMRREMDMLLTAGERISMALLAMALSDLGIASKSFTGSQSGIITDTSHGDARISEIRCFRIEESLSKGELAIVAGFQGISPDKEITTLGRGGSDTTAVALGVVLNSDDIYIYTDVSGFYSADPRIVSDARSCQDFDTRLAYQAASRGSQVLHPRCLELAAKFCKRVLVKNTLKPLDPGTWIKDLSMNSIEGPAIKVISHQENLLLLKAKAPSTRVLKSLNEKNIKPQQVQWEQGNLSFVLPKAQAEQAVKILSLLSFNQTECTSITLSGYGFESHPEIVEEILKHISENILIKQSVEASQVTLLVKSEAPVSELLNSLHKLTALN